MGPALLGKPLHEMEGNLAHIMGAIILKTSFCVFFDRALCDAYSPGTAKESFQRPPGKE